MIGLLENYDNLAAYDKDTFVNQNKIAITFSKATKFVTYDYWFAKCIGVQQDQIYKSND